MYSSIIVCVQTIPEMRGSFALVFLITEFKIKREEDLIGFHFGARGSNK